MAMLDERNATIPCNLCGGVEIDVLSRRSRSGMPLRTVSCHGCGLVRTDPRPHDSRHYYAEQYRLEYKGTFEPRAKHVVRAGHVALSRLEKIRSNLREHMSILDVGSGGGEFAYLLTTLGHEVDCVEPNRGYAGYSAREYGLRVTCSFIDEARLPDGTYDLITIWHVLEHTEDPTAVLRQLGRALKPGGLLVVEVPNVEATCQSPRSSFHEAHLYNFNVPTLHRMGAQAGLLAHSSTLSHDGGNITTIFRGAGEHAVERNVAAPLIPGNHDRVARIVRRHQRSAHWSSAHPYRRFAGRMGRAVTEWHATRTPASGRERLDRLYGSALRKPARSATAPSRSLPGWVSAAYALALVLEWLLLDEFLPQHGWAEHEALTLYMATQVLVVAGIVGLTRRPRTVAQFAMMAGWAGPLFALPAFC